MNHPDYYEVLGVSRDATHDEIRRAYRSLSLKYHPDRNSDTSVADIYKRINEAYEVLGDSDKRNMFDMESKFVSMPLFGGSGGGFGPRTFMFHGNGPPNPDDIFQMFFGMANPQMRVPTILHNLHITLEQAYRGDTVQISIERHNMKNGVMVNELVTLDVVIPIGTDDGEILILSEKGHCYGDVTGDVKVQCKYRGTKDFYRKGMDLCYEKHLTLKEALCGFSFEIQHLNGRPFLIQNTNNPSIIKPHQKRIIQGLGMIKNKQFGALIIEFIIDFPNTLTPAQIEQLSVIL